MTNVPQRPVLMSGPLASSWSPGDRGGHAPAARGNVSFVSGANDEDVASSAAAVGRSIFLPGASDQPADRQTLAIEAGGASLRVANVLGLVDARGHSSAPTSWNGHEQVRGSAFDASPISPSSQATCSQQYLRERTQRVRAIRVGLQTTTDQVKRWVHVAQIVSGLATLLALGVALSTALTPLSGGMLILSFAVLLVAQLGHAYSNVRTARLLRQSAEQVREHAFGCLELINVSPAAAVLDARQPPAGETHIYPWHEVRVGLMTAAVWGRAASISQKKAKHTLLSLARATVLQLLKGPIAWLTVLNSVWDLFKLMSKTKKMASRLHPQELDMTKVLEEEIKRLSSAEAEVNRPRQIERLRNLYVLQCLLTLPDANAIQERRDILQRSVGDDPQGGDRIAREAEMWALNQWQSYARHHSDRALAQPIETDPLAMSGDMASSVGSVRPQARARWVQEWFGDFPYDDFDRADQAHEPLLQQADRDIERFLAAVPRQAWRLR